MVVVLSVGNNPKGCAFEIDFGDKQIDTHVLKGLKITLRKSYEFASDYQIIVKGVIRMDSALDFYFPCSFKLTQPVTVLDMIYKPHPTILN